MNNKKRNFRTIASILSLVLVGGLQILNTVNEKKYDELSSRPSSYVAEDEVKRIKPESWDSMYLPSSLPYSYHLSISTMTDTYISCRFSQNDDLIALRYPSIHFTQWNSIKEVMPAKESELPPILKTGEFQMYNYEDKSEKQLEINTNATLEPETYNGKEYYFCDDTPDGDLLLLWYDEENTFALRIKPETAIKAKANFTLDDMLEIADSVENYS